VFFVCWKVSGGIKLRRGDLGLYLVHGLITALQIGTYNWGTSHSEAGRSSLFINVHPLVVAPLAWLILDEHLGSQGIVALCSATLGVIVILFPKLILGGGLAGDLVVLFSGIVFGAQTIAQKLTFSRIPPSTLLLVQTIVAIPVSFVASLILEGTDSYHFTTEAVAGLLYQGIAVSGVCFSLWMYLLSRYPAGRLATVAFITPFFGILFGNLTRGESLTPPLVVGGILVCSGIYLLARSRAIKLSVSEDVAVRSLKEVSGSRRPSPER
jgi:drug/metabolite transporter (DMT)-like permease